MGPTMPMWMGHGHVGNDEVEEAAEVEGGDR